jgi:CRP/FNR family transcriptional regulator
MSTLPVIHCDVCSSCKIYAACVAQRAREVVTKTRKSELVIARSHRIFHRKSALWERGDDFLGIYMLRSGSVKSFILSKEGNEHITKFHFPGDLLGLDGFNIAYNHTIKFLETSSACFFSATEIDLLTKHSTYFRNTLLKAMSDELVCHGAISLCYSTYTSEQRLAMFLVDLSSNFSQRGQSSAEFTLSMTRTEIANYLGMAMETVSRVMGKFQVFDIIDVNQRMVKINDIEALKNCLYGGDCLGINTLNNKPYNACHA